MHFILNTAIDPHFCALFSEAGDLIEVKSWDVHRRDGQEVYDFMARHNFSNQSISFIGAVTGPGGFSSLRVSSTVMQALSLKFGIPIRQIRADAWARDLFGHEHFILNSFGDTVWLNKCANEKIREYANNVKDDLARLPAKTIAEFFENESVATFFLPAEKAEHFINRSEQTYSDQQLAQSLLTNLQAQQPVKQFVPDYHFAPV